MSNSHCQKCGKPRLGHNSQFNQYFDNSHRQFPPYFDTHHRHFDNNSHFDGHHQHSHTNCGCHDDHFICDRFLCDKDFRLRLGGLQQGLNFRLRQLIGCKVKMELEGGKKVLASICFVGSDFVEIKVLKKLKSDEEAEVENEEVVKKTNTKKKKKKRKKKTHKSLMMSFDKINFVELDHKCDKDCDCGCSEY